MQPANSHGTAAPFRIPSIFGSRRRQTPLRGGLPTTFPLGRSSSEPSYRWLLTRVIFYLRVLVARGFGLGFGFTAFFVAGFVSEPVAAA